MDMVYAKKTEGIFKLYLYGVVGAEFDGGQIAKEIIFINEQFPDAKQIELHINSEGGSVINGFRAITAILDSVIPIHTYNDGYAMSMAGLLWLAAKKENRFAKNYSLLMLHAPFLVDEQGNPVEVDNEDDRQFIKAVTDQISQILQDNTGKSKEEVLNIISKDSFYDVKQAVREGFLERKNIIKGRGPKNLGADIKQNIYKISAFYNQNNNNMNWDEIKDALTFFNGQKKEVEESEGEKKLQAQLTSLADEKKTVQDSLNKANNRIAELEKEISGYANLKAELKKKEAEQVVEKAIADGKYEEKKKDDLIAMAVKDLEGFKAVTESINTVVKAPDVTELLESGKKAIADKYGLEVSDLTWYNLWKNHKDVLQSIEKNEKSLYEEIIKQAE